MKLIVGLGNPGLKYKSTKHNAGFWIIDALAKELKLSFNKRKFNAMWAQGKYQEDNVILVKPLTYMNLSGNAAKNFINYFKVQVSDVLIVFDDINLNLGAIRLRANGGAGGHNGLSSVIKDLGNKDIARLRFGIRTESGCSDLSKYVLSGFANKESKITAKDTIEIAKQAVICWLENDIEIAMSRFNKKGGRI